MPSKGLILFGLAIFIAIVLYFAYLLWIKIQKWEIERVQERQGIHREITLRCINEDCPDYDKEFIHHDITPLQLEQYLICPKCHRTRDIIETAELMDR